MNEQRKVKAATVEDALNELDASQTLHAAMALALTEHPKGAGGWQQFPER